MLGCERNHIGVVRREVANRIGGGGIARKDKGLAAAAAEVDVAAVAGLAQIREEAGATTPPSLNRS